jgi:hypothetical protein
VVAFTLDVPALQVPSRRAARPVLVAAIVDIAAATNITITTIIIIVIIIIIIIIILSDDDEPVAAAFAPYRLTSSSRTRTVGSSLFVVAVELSHCPMRCTASSSSFCGTSIPLTMCIADTLVEMQAPTSTTALSSSLLGPLAPLPHSHHIDLHHLGHGSLD